jgi:hypothetical protein
MVLSTKPSLILNPAIPPINRPDYVTISRSGDTEPTVDRYQIQDTDRVVIPAPKALQPGQTYALQFFKRNSSGEMRQTMAPVRFKVMEERDRQKITARLNSVKTTVPLNRLQQRLEILAQEGLFSDVLEEIQTSPALTPPQRQEALQTAIATWQKPPR